MVAIRDFIVVDDVNGIVNTTDTNNEIVIKQGVLVGALTGDAVLFSLGASSVYVHGMVAGLGSCAIEMGSGALATLGTPVGNNFVQISQNGVVTSENESAIQLFAGNNTVINSGVIASNFAGGVIFGGDNCVLINEGSIATENGIAVLFNLSTAGSVNTVHNFGLIAGGNPTGNGSAIASFLGTDIILNRGTISGEMALFGGDDRFDNEGGIITHTISFGAGDDELIGGGGRERASGGSGDDFMEFAGGNDFFIAGNTEEAPSDGIDDLDGGDGIDTYDARALSTAVTVRLHEQRAVGSEIGHDLVQFFENAFGGSGADTLVGDGGRNVLRGFAGTDNINGLEGNDRILGGNGADIITGNTGRDAMTGGADADIFDFNSTADSTVGDANRDIVTDFVTAVDDIDLLTIDANTGLGGNQAFVFIGAAAFGAVAGQLRFTNFAGTQYTVVEGDVNGDSVADFQIGLLGSIALAAGDFIL